MSSKEQFIANKGLCEWWGQVSSDPKFDLVLLHASAITLEACPSAEQREGAIVMRQILLSMSQKDSEAPEFPKTGLNHNLDPKRKTIEPEKSDKP